jgi:TetR/AcrR family transcriptional regulator, transcriptional repressor for nem operon
VARPAKFDREEVLDKAMLLFWRKGYEATLLDDLTREMGINRPSLYNTFGDKDALYLESLTRYGEIHGGKMLATLERAHSIQQGFRDIFADLIDESTQGCCRGCMIVNNTVEQCSVSESANSFAKETDEASKRAFATAIRRAQQEGALAPTRDPDALAVYLYSAIQGLQLRAKAGDSKRELEAVAELSLTVLD